MTVALRQLFNWRIHVLALLLACLAELIGIVRFDIGIGTVLLLPLHSVAVAFTLCVFIFSVLQSQYCSSARACSWSRG